MEVLQLERDSRYVRGTEGNGGGSNGYAEEANGNRGAELEGGGRVVG